VKITLAVTTWNDERTIKRFMEHHKPHVDEVVWVDDFSSDKTVEIVTPYIDKRLISTTKEYACEAYRQKLSELSSNDWILMLDSDQFVDFGILDKLREHAEKADLQDLFYYVFELETIKYNCGNCPVSGWKQMKFYNRKYIRWSIFPHCGAFNIKTGTMGVGGGLNEPILGKIWHLTKDCEGDEYKHRIDHMLRIYRWMDKCKYLVRTYTDESYKVEREFCIQSFKMINMDLENDKYQCSRDPNKLIWIENDAELETHLRNQGLHYITQ